MLNYFFLSFLLFLKYIKTVFSWAGFQQQVELYPCALSTCEEAMTVYVPISAPSLCCNLIRKKLGFAPVYTPAHCQEVPIRHDCDGMFVWWMEGEINSLHMGVKKKHESKGRSREGVRGVFWFKYPGNIQGVHNYEVKHQVITEAIPSHSW